MQTIGWRTMTSDLCPVNVGKKEWLDQSTFLLMYFSFSKKRFYIQSKHEFNYVDWFNKCLLKMSFKTICIGFKKRLHHFALQLMLQYHEKGRMFHLMFERQRCCQYGGTPSYFPYSQLIQKYNVWFCWGLVKHHNCFQTNRFFENSTHNIAQWKTNW